MNKIYNVKTIKSELYLQPKSTRTMRQATGKAVESANKSSDPQSDQAPVLCPRVYQQRRMAENNWNTAFLYLFVAIGNDGVGLR